MPVPPEGCRDKGCRPGGAARRAPTCRCRCAARPAAHAIGWAACAGNLFGEMLVDALRQQDLVVVQRSGQGDELGRTQAVVQPAGRNQNRLAHFRQMTADRLLDLGRHHPAAIHLEQIVFPPTVTVGTRLVALEQVAGAVPATCEARLLLFAGPPVTDSAQGHAPSTPCRPASSIKCPSRSTSRHS